MEENLVLFSIIIPTYNRAGLLKKAIQSILDQTFQNWELIIIDDGSEDNTQELGNSFEDIRIRYFYQKNKERSAARNVGIQHAKGKYLCFLDDDDYFLSNHLEVLEQRIKEKNYPIAIFRTGMISKFKNKEIKESLFDSKKVTHPIPFFLNHMVGMHTLCFHRSILKKYKFDERWFHFQDTHLLIRCLLKYSLYQISEHTAVYVRYPEMGSLNIFRMENAEDRTENNVNAIKDLFEQSGDENTSSMFQQNIESYLISKKYLNHANGALFVGRKKLAINNIT